MVNARHLASLHVRLLVLLVIRVAKRLNSRSYMNYVSSDVRSLLTMRLGIERFWVKKRDTSVQK